MKTEKPLDEYETAVLKGLEPGYDYLIMVIPSVAKINDFATAGALADLKRRGYIKFEGRGRYKSAYLTPEGVKAREGIPT